MLIGVPREIKLDEYRVALLPVGVHELTKAGHHVLVEAGAGLGSGLADHDYLQEGAELSLVNLDRQQSLLRQAVQAEIDRQAKQRDRLRDRLISAMQDYKRAVVIGSKQTFGKGTVQNVIPLENIVRGNEYGDLGAIKLTTQKFYRINGGSTQLEGVKSDVVVPDRCSYIDLGEKDQQNPLQWDKISPAEFKPWDGYIDYETTIARSATRIKAHPQIALIEENALWLKKQQEETRVPLDYQGYLKREKENKEKSQYFKSKMEYDSKLDFNSLTYEQELFTKDSVLREKRDRWHKNLAKDVYVEEAINVLEDLKLNNIEKDKLASRVQG